MDPIQKKKNSASDIFWKVYNGLGLPAAIAFAWLYIAVPQIETIRDDGDFVKKTEVDNYIKSAVLEEREHQADKNTGSLSWNITRELEASGMPMPREQVAPSVAKMVVWGFKRQKEYEEQQTMWDEFKRTRYICPIIIEGKWYFRYEDGDYPISQIDLGGGYYSRFWRYPVDDDKRPLTSISKVKDQQ